MSYKFRDIEHKEFFEKWIKTDNKCNPYRKSLFYILGLTKETRHKIDALYNTEENYIKFDGLNKEWQTETTLKICRLAFNLYNGSHGEQDEDEKALYYTPYYIFDCELVVYMLEAVKIRYKEYTGLPY